MVQINNLLEEIYGIANPNEMYSLTFNGSSLASGTYFYSLRSASRNEVKKMLLAK